MVLIEDGRRLLDGIADADSLTLDPHKWFGQTFEAGCVLVRQGRLLEKSFSLRPEYMQDVEPNDDEVNFCDRGIALSRRFRALKIWLSLKVLGVAWYRHLVRHCCLLAEYAEALLRHTPGFEILSPARLSIVCFRHRRSSLSEEELNRWNLDLVDRLRATRRAFISSTRLDGLVALRFCFVNWRTTAADVEMVIDLLRQLANDS
jgi:glutamate/tyrosine decarboxylase-like PLP-dependent enzyme